MDFVLHFVLSINTIQEYCLHDVMWCVLQFIDLKLAVLGNVDAGKSTLLGVLTHGELENGHGRSRLNLFRHLHEIQSGRTSSISHEIIGFNNIGQVNSMTLGDAIRLLCTYSTAQSSAFCCCLCTAPQLQRIEVNRGNMRTINKAYNVNRPLWPYKVHQNNYLRSHRIFTWLCDACGQCEHRNWFVNINTDHVISVLRSLHVYTSMSL